MLRLARAAERDADQAPAPSPPGDTSGARITVVLPVHDAPAVLSRCLDSLTRHRCGAELIVVDDGSKLPEARHLLADFCQRHDARLIRHDVPQSHSRACEAGAALATREVLCLLNSDTVVTPHCWQPILDVFDANPDAAAVGPMTSHATTPQVLHDIKPLRHGWSDATIDAFARRFTAVFRRDYLNPTLAPAVFPVKEVAGFAFFIRRSVWQQFDGFDARLPDYGNESELCIRLRKAGHTLFATRRSYIHHLAKMSFTEAHGTTEHDRLQAEGQRLRNEITTVGQ